MEFHERFLKSLVVLFKNSELYQVWEKKKKLFLNIYNIVMYGGLSFFLQ